MLALLCLLLPVAAMAEDSQEGETDGEAMLRQVLSRLDLSEWDRWFIAQDPSVEFVPSDFLLGAARGSAGADTLLQSLPEARWSEAKETLGDLAALLGFGVLCAVLHALQPDGAAVPDAVLRLLGGGLVLTRCALLLRTAANLLTTVRSVTDSLLPLLLMLFAAFDLSAGAGSKSGMTLLMDGMIRLSTDLLFPLALVGCVLTALDGFASDRLAPVGAFCHRAARWTLRLGSAFYLAVTAVRALVAARADSLLLRSARIAAGTLPDVGRLTAEAVDLYASVLETARSLLGLCAILMLCLALLRPVVRVVCRMLALRLAAAIVAPLGQSAYAKQLEAGSSMMGIAASAVIVTLTMALALIALSMGVFAG